MTELTANLSEGARGMSHVFTQCSGRSFNMVLHVQNAQSLCRTWYFCTSKPALIVLLDVLFHYAQECVACRLSSGCPAAGRATLQGQQAQRFRKPAANFNRNATVHDTNRHYFPGEQMAACMSRSPVVAWCCHYSACNNMQSARCQRAC